MRARWTRAARSRSSAPRSPFDVVEAFSGLAETSEEIDTDQLAESLTTLADLSRNTPEEFRAALQGVSALSANVADKNEQIGELLRNLETVSGVLDERDEDIIALMEDADVLFRALVKRRESIHRLLVSTSQMSKELTALVRQSRADLKPALTHLESVVKVLNKNEDNIDNSLRLMAPFYRVFANTLGNGPWFDTYIQNMPPAPQVGGLIDMRKLIVPVRGRRAARGCRVHVHRRRGPQDGDRALPAHHRHLRGQRRPGPGCAGRHRRLRHPLRHRRRGHDVLRLRGAAAVRRAGRDHLAVGRRRPLRPAHPGLRRR